MAAVGHFFAFPYKEYSGASIGLSPGFTTSLAHALMLNDFYHDTVHQVSHCVHFSFVMNVSHLRLVAIWQSPITKETRIFLLNHWSCSICMLGSIQVCNLW